MPNKHCKRGHRCYEFENPRSRRSDNGRLLWHSKAGHRNRCFSKQTAAIIPGRDPVLRALRAAADLFRPQRPRQ